MYKVCKSCKEAFNGRKERVFCSKKCFGYSFKGKKLSDSHREKLSIARFGVAPWNKGKFGYSTAGHSEETKKKMSMSIKAAMTDSVRDKIRLSKIGDKNPQWKGGVTEKNCLIRRSSKYKSWRKSVLERDNYTCIWCFSKEDLNVDHIKPFAFFPDLRFEIDNGRVLCLSCHKTTETYGVNSNATATA